MQRCGSNHSMILDEIKATWKSRRKRAHEALKPKHPLLFDHFSSMFFFPQRSSHQFLTHVNALFQYLMFLYGVLTIEHGNGGHILPSYFSSPASILSKELRTPMQQESLPMERHT